MDAGLAQVQGWSVELEALCERIAPRFGRVEVRRRAGAFLRGLLAGVERKNGWQLAEHAGEHTPDGMQRLLNHARWDPDQVRDDLRGYVAEHLGDPQAVLVVDETGFLKKGTKSAGVQRQYSGTAGRIENCQVGVFLAYAGPSGHALIDRELYLPEGWTADRQRCRVAGIPEQVEFQTKPQLARVMLERALDAGVPCGWVTADEVDGGDGRLRRWLEERDVPHVLAVKRSQALWSLRLRQECAATLASQLPARATLAELVRVAGTRWMVESGFQAGKGQTGLDHYQVRRYQAWYRHVTLAMVALAFLAVMRVRAVPVGAGGGGVRRSGRAAGAAERA